MLMSCLQEFPVFSTALALKQLQAETQSETSCSAWIAPCPWQKWLDTNSLCVIAAYVCLGGGQ